MILLYKIYEHDMLIQYHHADKFLFDFVEIKKLILSGGIYARLLLVEVFFPLTKEKSVVISIALPLYPAWNSPPLISDLIPCISYL